MTMRAYYNDNDPRAAAWLRELIADGLLPPGDVDERSIADVAGADLQGYVQCHFFAGIGGWPYALRLAGWPDDQPVWTGSCPCQPFSCAGKRKGTEDKRHLWPEFYRLIAECRPPVIFGEQVASKDGRLWLAGVRADLEALGYAVGAADLCAAGIGAPHIRQRLFWVADAPSRGLGTDRGAQREARYAEFLREDGRMADAEHAERRAEPQEHGNTYGRDGSGGRGIPSRMAHPDGRIPCDGEIQRSGEHAERDQDGGAGFWSSSIWLPCSDGKARRIEPTIFPLAHGVPGRVGLLRGAGNAIVPQVAAEFIRAYQEIKGKMTTIQGEERNVA